jgi:drug/metabolite transporter (DMT)-like permease
VGLISLAIKHEKLPPLRGNHLALIAGVLDAGGTLFYVLATHATRLDVAVVLSAMYPAPTVFLARLLFGERISLAQWSGVVLCLVAISLIAA